MKPFSTLQESPMQTSKHAENNSKVWFVVEVAIWCDSEIVAAAKLGRICFAWTEFLCQSINHCTANNCPDTSELARLQQVISTEAKTQNTWEDTVPGYALWDTEQSWSNTCTSKPTINLQLCSEETGACCHCLHSAIFLEGSHQWLKHGKFSKVFPPAKILHRCTTYQQYSTAT